jgi:hypothetical protein
LHLKFTFKSDSGLIFNAVWSAGFERPESVKARRQKKAADDFSRV